MPKACRFCNAHRVRHSGIRLHFPPGLRLWCVAVEIVFVTSELAPYSRSGEPSELADVAASLPKALRGLGHKVVVISPLYRDIDPTARSLARRLSTLNVELRGKTYACTLYDGRTTGGVDLIFLGNAELFGSRTAADVNDDLSMRAAALLGCAAAQLAAKRDPAVDVLHAHGAGAALAVACAKNARPELVCVLSVYEGQPALPLENGLAELGTLSANSTAASNANTQWETASWASQLAELRLAPSLAGIGLAFADGVIVNAESTLQTMLSNPDVGPAFAAKRGAAAGIVNGVDSSLWNPLIDSNLSARFDATHLEGKARCKASLQYMFGLGIAPDLPVIAAIGDLSEARGGDLIAQVAQAALRNEVQLIVLANESPAAEALTVLAEQYPERLALRTSHDEKERHLALGGADFLLLPARKPVALDIAIAAMRYGTLPIVRPVGPLADFVVDVDSQLETGNGFLITDADSGELLAGIQRALGAFAQRTKFDALRKRVMLQDLSWERSARRYEHLYKRIRQSLQQPAA
jgi:starch synthase